MKKLNIIFFFFSIIFTILSCINKEKITLEAINIDEKENLMKGSKLSEVIENFRFIPLESTKNSLVGRINKIRVFDNKIFVLDAMSTKSLFVFSETGDFMYKVGKVGNGPGEFLLPMDFTINKKNKEIIILDAERKRMNFYDIAGKFIKTQKLDFFGEGLEYDNKQDRIIFKAAGRDDNLIVADKEGIKENSYFPFNKVIESINPGNPIRTLNDSIVFFRLYTRDTIYQINKASISPYRIINFKNEDKSFLKSSKGTVKDLDRINNLLLNYVETEQNIWLSYLTRSPKKSFHALFINKNNNNKRYFSRHKFVNDIFYDNYFLNVATTVENEFVFIIQPYKVLEIMGEAGVKEIKNKKTMSLVNEFKETSNPVLMFATLKDF